MIPSNMLMELNAFRAWADKPPLPTWRKRNLAELELYREIAAREAADKVAEKERVQALRAEDAQRAEDEKLALVAKMAADAEAMNVKTAKRSAKLAAANKAAIAEADKRESAATPAVAPVKAAPKTKAPMPEANGIRRPKADTVCGQLWATFDGLGFGMVIGDAMKAGALKGINEYTIRTQCSRWRKFNGIKMK